MTATHQARVFLLCSVLALFCTATGASTCNRTCASSPPVPYPFGFSNGCPIRLNCSSTGEILLGGYSVLNFTSSTVILNVPPSCNSSIDASFTAGLFGANYAMVASNVLFLRNCTHPNFDCNISTDIISQRLNLNCGQQPGDISCYSSGGRPTGFLTYESFSNATARCKLLFASVRYVMDAHSQVSLVFGTAEIGWWLNGECRCAANASCQSVNGTSNGYRCSCHEGFVGDGFLAGDGCHRVGARKDSAKVGILIGGIAAAGASVLFSLVFLCYRIRRRSFSKSEEDTQRLLSESCCAVAIYSHKDLERATSNFSDAHKLGAGAYATVYMGKFSNTGLVAIKRLKHPDTDNVEHVINEIKLVSSISHPNLVHLLGCCIGSREHILVYEFMPNGTLSQHLHRERGDGLPWPARVSIAAETASAIAHLHTAVHPPIYHRDIKSSNILLDYDLRPKLADFGLSRAAMGELSHISTAPQGTPGYVDPQYHQNFHLSDKSDVYSFGVVLVEMITAMKVVDFRRAPTEVNLASLAVDRIGKGLVEDIVDPIMKEDWDGRTRASVQKVAELAFRCLAFYKEARPSMTEVAEELERIRMEGCSSARHEGSQEGPEEEATGKRMVAEIMAEGKANAASPASVQEQWASEHSSSSSSCASTASSSYLNR